VGKGKGMGEWQTAASSFAQIVTRESKGVILQQGAIGAWAYLARERCGERPSALGLRSKGACMGGVGMSGGKGASFLWVELREAMGVIIAAMGPM
jgi:hypothetical protein